GHGGWTRDGGAGVCFGDAAVGDRVGEAVGAVVVGVRGVADGAVGQEGDRAVAALGHAAERGGALEIVGGGAVGAGQHVGGEHGVDRKSVVEGEGVGDGMAG